MKILVTSDLHLSSRIWSHRPIEGDSYYSWEQIVNLALEHEVDAIILAGDILDKQVNVSEPIHKLLAGVTRLLEHKVSVYYTQGQHEYQASPWLQASTEAIWLHERSVHFDGWQVTGCDYQNSKEKLQQFLKSEQALGSQVLVCHQVWEDFMGDIAKPQGCFNDIPAGVNYLITGDYHKNLIHNHGALTVLSPGSTHMRSIAEPEDKKVFLIATGSAGKFSEEEKLAVQTLSLLTRRCIRIDVAKANNCWATLKKLGDSLLAQALQYAEDNALPPELMLPLIQLVHTSSDIELVDKFKQNFEQKAHLFFKQVEAKQLSGQEEQEQIISADRIGMLQCVDSYVDKVKQPLVHELVLILLQSPDPEQALQQWVDSHI